MVYVYFYRIRDTRNNILASNVASIGLKSNTHRRNESHVMMTWKGQTACMYIFYNETTDTLPVNSSYNLCARSGYICKYLYILVNS